MKKVCPAAVVAAALVVGHLHLTAAESVKLRFLAAVYADEKGGGFKQPEGLACDSTGQSRGRRHGQRPDRPVHLRGRQAGWRDRGQDPGGLGALEGPAELEGRDLRPRREAAADRAPRRPPASSRKWSRSRGRRRPERSSSRASRSTRPTTSTCSTSSRTGSWCSTRQGSSRRRCPCRPTPASARTSSVDARGTILALDSIGRRMYSAGKDATAFAPFGGDLAGSLVSLPTYITASQDGISRRGGQWQNHRQPRT